MSSAEPQLYDFAKPRRFSLGELNALDQLVRESEKKLRAAVSDLLRMDVEVFLDGLDQCRFESLFPAGQERRFAFATRVKPLNGQGLLLVNARFLFAAIDRLSGGRGSGQQAAREPTPVDDIVMRPFLQDFLSAVSTAWATSAQPLQFELDRRLMGHVLQAFADGKDAMLVVQFSVKSEKLEGVLRLVVPYPMMRSHLDAILPRRAEKAASRPAQELMQVLSGVRVPIKACIGHGTLRMQDLLAIVPGDVIVLDHKVSAPVALSVSGKQKFLGKLGVRDGRKAVLVETVLTPNTGKGKP